MRFIVFNNFYKRLKEGTIDIIRLKDSIMKGEYNLLISCYYDLTYRYYSMDETDRSNLELILSLGY
jgi:hypothetical protein